MCDSSAVVRETARGSHRLIDADYYPRIAAVAEAGITRLVPVDDSADGAN